MKLITKEFISELQHQDFLNNRKLCGISFVGSMLTNVKDQTATNDYDFVLIYLPSFEEMATIVDTKLSTHVTYESNVLQDTVDCQVQDIRFFFSQLQKSNLEVINPVYGFNKLKEQIDFDLYDYLDAKDVEQLLEYVYSSKEKLYFNDCFLLSTYLKGLLFQREQKFKKAFDLKDIKGMAKEYANFYRGKQIIDYLLSATSLSLSNLEPLIIVSKESQPYLLRNTPELFESEPEKYLSKIESFKAGYDSKYLETHLESLKSGEFNLDLQELFKVIHETILEILYTHIGH